MTDKKDHMLDDFLDELDNLEISKDLSFYIENQNGKAYLIVSPPGEDHKKINVKEVINRLKIIGVTNYDESFIEDAVQKADNKPVPVGNWPRADLKDANAKVEISQDYMEAKIKLSPPKNNGAHLSLEQLYSIVAEHKIKEGLLHETLKAISKEPVYNESIIIARGKQAKAGKNGKITILFNTGNTFTFSEDKHGKVDYKEFEVIKSVKKDEVIAIMEAPVKGEDGFDILGNVMRSRDGKKTEWKLGHNVFLSDDKLNLHSSIAGRPVVDNSGKIRVDEIVQLENVDYSTGNIDFPGTIIVNKSIADDFKLTTEGSIIIKKSVGKVYLKAKGDIILSGGFMGKDVGTIESESNIYARFVERGKLIAGQSIFIKDASMHSELIAGDSIIIKGGRGDFIGGSGIAGSNIICNKLGAIVETKTELFVGTPPEFIVTLDSIKMEIIKFSELLKKIDFNLNKLKDKLNRNELSADEKAAFSKLKKAQKKYGELLKNSEYQHKKAISTYQGKPNTYLHIAKEVYYGVEAHFGNQQSYKSTMKPLRGPIYLYLSSSGQIIEKNSPITSSENNK